MVTEPPDTPWTTPVLLTVATAVLLLLQVPDDMFAVRVILSPVHTSAGPLIDSDTVSAPTVTGI